MSLGVEIVAEEEFAMVTWVKAVGAIGLLFKPPTRLPPSIRQDSVSGPGRASKAMRQGD